MTTDAQAKPDTLEAMLARYNDPAYWQGGGRDGYTLGGYEDFAVNGLKVERILQRRPQNVLEVGCARGYVVKRLRDQGVDAHGVDISAYAISQASEDVKPYLQVAFGHKLPFPDNSFEQIVTFGMMEHLTDDLVDATLAEFRRVAKRVLLSITLSTDYNGESAKDHPASHPRSWWMGKALHYFAADDIDLWSDSLESWCSWKSGQCVIIAPGIAPVTPHIRYGGIEKLAALFARGLAPVYAVTLMAPQGSHAPPGAQVWESNLAQNDFREPGLAAAYGHWYVMQAKRFTGQTPTAMTDGTYGVIIDLSHSHPVWSLTVPQVGVVWHDPAIMQPNLPGTNVVALSEWQAKRLKTYQKREARVIDPHVYDDAFFFPDPQAEPVEDRFLYIGRLSPDKGALQAIRLCQKSGARLDLLGPQTGGEPAEYVKAVLAECDGDQITYYPSVSAEAKRTLLRRSRALLYPVSYPEGTGEAHSHKSAEAIGMGCPVIAYSQGALPEVIESGKTGFVVKTPAEFLDAMKRVDSIDRAACAKEGLRRWGRPALMGRWLPVTKDVIRGDRW